MTGVLHEIGMRYGTDKATFHGYLDFYQDQLPTREFAGSLLEIGVMDGASLKMWRDYYPNALIVGVDPHRPTKVNGCYVFDLDATNASHMDEISEWTQFGVIVDDGSHMTEDQQRSFDLLWPSVAPGGVYVIEDLHTSYMSNYVNSPRTTLEWLADLSVREPYAVEVWRRPQGEAEGFVSRHGFPAEAVEWTGPEIAESITAVIRKPGSAE